MRNEERRPRDRVARFLPVKKLNRAPSVRKLRRSSEVRGAASSRATASGTVRSAQRWSWCPAGSFIMGSPADHGPLAAAPAPILGLVFACTHHHARILLGKRHLEFAHRERLVDRHLALRALVTAPLDLVQRLLG